MSKARIDLFVWHGWRPHPVRDAFDLLLDGCEGLSIRNFGLAWFDPMYRPGTAEGRAHLVQMVSLQIQPARLVIALPEMADGEQSREWLALQLAEAERQGKPILVVDRLADGPLPDWIAAAADAVVVWDTDAVGAVLREYAA